LYAKIITYVLTKFRSLNCLSLGRTLQEQKGTEAGMEDGAEREGKR
jgi:hypothetical protein